MLPQRDSTGREGGQKGCGSKGGKEKEEAQTGGITKHTHTHTKKKDSTAALLLFGCSTRSL